MHFVTHVLVIGGGDGGVLGEVSRWVSVDQVDISETDEMVYKCKYKSHLLTLKVFPRGVMLVPIDHILVGHCIRYFIFLF